ncbi:MAG: hypothetical protein AABZ06_02300 [Bdellovibrionota bacterium]
MDTNILKKRLSTFRTGKTGRLSKISDDLVVDLLRAWESWAGQSKDFYKELGMSKQQLANVIKKGKRLMKNGNLSGSSDFKELKLESLIGAPTGMGGPIEVSWEKGKVIRFSQVDALVDFLKKVA